MLRNATCNLKKKKSQSHCLNTACSNIVGENGEKVDGWRSLSVADDMLLFLLDSIELIINKLVKEQTCY